MLLSSCLRELTVNKQTIEARLLLSGFEGLLFTIIRSRLRYSGSLLGGTIPPAPSALYSVYENVDRQRSSWGAGVLRPCDDVHLFLRRFYA